MRAILLVFPLTVFILSSCSRYQYVTVKGVDINQNEQQEFVVDNDTVMIRYNFNGLNAPINITIENKLNVPVYIDWRQSALIINDKAISYVPNTVPLTGTITGSSVNWNRSNTSTSSGNIEVKAMLNDDLGFIPPRSYINKNPMGVTNKFFSPLDSAFRHEKLKLNNGFPYARVKHATFSEQSSPLQFRSYLTIIIGDQTAKPVSYDQTFYISDIYATELKPKTFWTNRRSKGNQYYVKETTGFGKGFGVVAGVATFSAIGVLEQRNTDNLQE